MNYLIYECIIAAAVILAVLMIVFRKAIGIKCFPCLLAMAVAAVAGCISVYALNNGPLTANTTGDPAEAVDSFFSHILNGEYEESYALLKNYSSLGLENVPGEEDALMIYKAVSESYSYELSGDCMQDGFTAKQMVTFSHLDATAFEKDLCDRFDGYLERAVEKAPANEVYDAERNYLPEFINRVYLDAIADMLKTPEKYEKEEVLTLSTEFDGRQWYIIADSSLLNALGGF